MTRACCILALITNLAALPAGAQTAEDPFRIGPGITPPRLIRSVTPQFSPEARLAHVQGTVILQFVVDENGHTTDISLISPLGYGLDEEAQAAVEKWVFAPGTKGGAAIKILATAEVNFHMQGVSLDEQDERNKSDYDASMKIIAGARPSPDELQRAVKSVTELARKKYPAALSTVGLWKIAGEHLPKDRDEGLDFLMTAADLNYGPALYEAAVRHLEGRDLPKDPAAGIKEMRSAARFGSGQAQAFLGNRYEKGDGVPPDPERARTYFRLCAAQGIGLCEYRLGRMLYDAPQRREREYLEALALLELAAKHKLAEAAGIVAGEMPKLTAEQRSWVETLERQILHQE